MSQLPMGTVTLLFTDIEGSTQLLQQLGERYTDMLSECRSLLRTAFHAFGGHEVDTQGDAFFVAFSRATDAVCAAVEMQRALARHAWPNGVIVRARIGLHTGEPQLSSEGYVGLDVQHAARIMSAGHGGQVLLSQTTRDLVVHGLPEEVGLRDLGGHRLKDLQRSSHLYQLGIASLQASFPPLKTLDISRHNLPVQPTQFLGREQEVTAVCDLLSRENLRMLTLTGPGGTGKTRLGLQVAAELSDLFASGVFFVNLAPISDPALVVPAIVETLGIREGVGQSLLESLEENLRQKHLLLLLDNFEQVVSAAEQVADLLVACPQLKVLVTSREVLHVRAEHEFLVPPLALPDPNRLSDLAVLSHNASVALFLQRAQATRPDFQMTNANARAIAEICTRLDGLPLAIELAAARIKLLPPQALLKRLEQRLAILTGASRDVPARQQTLRNTIAWSYHLLDAAEQRLFRCLSVFVGGWILEAVEAVCYDETEHRTLIMPSALDGVASLLDKSLLQRVEQEAGEEQEPRFQMLVTVGEYGQDCLRVNGEAEIIQRAHAAYFLALAERAEPLLKGAQQPSWLLRLEQERENLRAALTWFTEHNEAEQALRLSGSLWYFWYLQGDWGEGRRWLETALGLSSAQGSTEERAKALYSAGELAYWQVDYPAARRLLEESIALYRALGDDRGLASPLGRLGVLLQLQGDLAAGGPLAEESITLCRTQGNNWVLCAFLPPLGWAAAQNGDYIKAGAILQGCLTLARELGDKSLIADTLTVNGLLSFIQGEPTEAAALIQEGLSLARELGDKAHIANALELLGFIALSLDDLSQATVLFTEGFSLGQELGDKHIIVWHLLGLAQVAAAADEPHRAAHLFGAAEALVEPRNLLLSPFARADYEQAVATIHAQLGEKAFAAAWAEGRTMSPEQALAAWGAVAISPSSSAVSHLPAPATSSPPASLGLTRRELEVLRLLAMGLPDAQIAERLVLSLHTVHAHLRTIYSKLDVTSRSAATRYAFEHQLVGRPSP